MRTLGEFAALPAGDVLARFGFDAALAHRLAAGGDQRPLAARRPPPDLPVSEVYDDPLERVDVAAFAARSLAERLHDKLAGYGLACTRLGIEAVTAHGQELHRVWRHDGLLTTAAIADRVRWQLDGWLTGTARRGGAPRPGRPPASCGSASSPRAWSPTPRCSRGCGARRGRSGSARTGRSAGCRACLGPESVVTAVLGGGRSPADQVRLVPWGDERGTARPGEPPWPGRFPAPAPALVLPAAAAGRPSATRTGAPVGVSARLAVTAPPATIAVGTGRARGDRRLGRAVAGRRAVVGAGRGAAAARGSRSPWPTAARCCWSWRRAGGRSRRSMTGYD